MATFICRGTEDQAKGFLYAKQVLGHYVPFSVFFLCWERDKVAQVDLELTVLGWGLIWGKIWFKQISSTHFDEILVSSQLQFTTFSSDFSHISIKVDFYLLRKYTPVNSNHTSSFFCPRQPLWVLPSLISIFLRFYAANHAIKMCIFLGIRLFTVFLQFIHVTCIHQCFCFLFSMESYISVCA